MPSHSTEEEDKPCRACTDFKSWAKQQTKAGTSGATTTNKTTPPAPPPQDCPLDKEELGRSTWGFLHSMAAYYPKKPSKFQQEDMGRFFQIFAQYYPCEHCAIDFQADIKQNPPATATREDLEKWLCERHNTVNVKLGKPVYDCSKVSERWRDGWKDGSCF